MERGDATALAGVRRALLRQQRAARARAISRAALLVNVIATIDAGIDALRDQVRDLRGDDARLAAARAGEHEQRPVGVAHGLALRRIEGERHRRLARICAGV